MKNDERGHKYLSAEGTRFGTIACSILLMVYLFPLLTRMITLHVLIFLLLITVAVIITLGRMAWCRIDIYEKAVEGRAIGRHYFHLVKFSFTYDQIKEVKKTRWKVTIICENGNKYKCYNGMAQEALVGIRKRMKQDSVSYT